MKILFFPSDLGGGFGHISRCMALADSFCKRGSEAAFALSGPHFKKVSKTGYKTFSLSPPRLIKSDPNGPAYIYVPGMAYQIVRDGFDNPNKVERSLAEGYEIIKMFRPDILVGDGYPVTWLLGQKAGIPVVQIVKSIAHPNPKQIVWWEKEPDGIIFPDPRPVFNPVLNMLGLPEITRAEQLLSGDLLLLPSIYTLDPMDPLPDHTFYVGGLVRKPSLDKASPDWFQNLNRSHPIIYVTVGGAAGHGGGRRFFKMVADTFEGTDCHVVISTGRKIDIKSFGLMPSNIRLVSWVPGPEMIGISDLVIFHGGYTRIEILMNDLPSIIIPFHSEQEYYGRIMEKAGIAKVVHYSDEPYQCKKTYWKGGNRWRKSRPFTVYVRFNMTLKPNVLKTAISNVLFNKEMKHKAQSLRHEMESLGGCDAVVDLIGKKLI